MATLTACTSNDRRFNWDDDEEDDFDLDAWKATIDTSSPSAHDLGPLQLALFEEKIESVVLDGLECYSYEDAYRESPASHITDMAADEWSVTVSEPECTPEPEVAEASPEAAYSKMLDTLIEEQLASARYEYLTHAIGIYFEGKEEPDAPAYPELSPYHGQRYRYARTFQHVKYANGRRQGEVYRNSPLVFVTGIEDAHLIDDEICYGEFEEDISDHIQIDEGEQAELELVQLDFTVIFEEGHKDANEQVKLQRLPALDHFPPDELQELIGKWKAQQEKEGGNYVGGQDDSSSIDTWEKSDADEDDIIEALGTDEDKENGDPNTFSSIRPLRPNTFTYNEELDFNDVVFCVDSDIENRDEGYISSSPPISPVLDIPADGCDWQNEQTESQSRPKVALRVDSMDALDGLGVVEEYSPANDRAEEEATLAEILETSPDCFQIDENGNERFLEIKKHAEVTVTVTSCGRKDIHSAPTVEVTI